MNILNKILKLTLCLLVFFKPFESTCLASYKEITLRKGETKSVTIDNLQNLRMEVSSSLAQFIRTEPQLDSTTLKITALNVPDPETRKGRINFYYPHTHSKNFYSLRVTIQGDIDPNMLGGGATTLPAKPAKASHKTKSKSKGKTSPKLYFFDDTLSNSIVGNVNLSLPWLKKVKFIHTKHRSKRRQRRLYDLTEENFHPHSGLQLEQINQTIQDISEGKVSSLVFDWDLTIISQNGIHIPSPAIPLQGLQDLISRYKKQDYLPEDSSNLVKRLVFDHWLFPFTSKSIENVIANSQRIKALKQLFALAEKEKIPVSVVTSNEAMALAHWRIISEVFSLLGAKLPQDRIFYAGKEGSSEPKKADFILKHLAQ